MGSSLIQILVNGFLCYHEKIWLQNCLFEFKSVIYRKYFDEKVLHFHSKHHVKKFQSYLNCQHKNNRLISEKKLHGFLTLT